MNMFHFTFQILSMSVLLVLIVLLEARLGTQDPHEGEEHLEARLGRQDPHEGEEHLEDTKDSVNTPCAYKNGSLSPLLTVVPPTLLSPPTCSYCHTLVQGRDVLSQGCWAQGDGCSTPCTLHTIFPPSLLQFCCCSGDHCNQEWVEDQGQEETPHRSREMSTGVSGMELGLVAVFLGLLCLLVILTLLLIRQYQYQTTPIPIPISIRDNESV